MKQDPIQKATPLVRVLRDPVLPELDILHVQHSEHIYPNHIHEHYTIGVMEFGRCFCLGAKREDSMVSPGFISLINPGQVHSGVSLPGEKSSYKTFSIPVSLLHEIAQEACDDEALTPEFEHIAVQSPQLMQLFLLFADLIDQDASPLARESIFVSACVKALRHASSPSVPDSHKLRNSKAVSLAKDYLLAHLHKKISLQELATQAGLSRYHFLRVFKRETGLSPHAFLLQQRIERSKRLLRQNMPIASTAVEVGFVDQSHFTHAFKQLVCATPGQFVAGL